MKIGSVANRLLRSFGFEIRRYSRTSPLAAYHLKHRLRAQQAQEVLREAGFSINTAQSKQITEYAKEIFGSTDYEPWLRVYTAVKGGFHEGWIPDNFYGAFVVKAKRPFDKLSSIKSLNRFFLSTAPTPDIGYISNNGAFLNPNKCQNNAEVFFSDGSKHKFVFKADASEQGKAIEIFASDTGLSVTHPTKNPFSSLRKPGVFQKYIYNNEFFAPFNDTALATLRITTVSDLDGRSSARCAYLRLGRAGDTNVRSASHVRVPVDMATGTLFDLGHLADWKPSERHPDSGERFSGKRIPAFAQAVHIAFEMQNHFPELPCIGWDFALDRDGKWWLLEWNAGHNDIKYSEATVGPCFCDLNWAKTK